MFTISCRLTAWMLSGFMSVSAGTLGLQVEGSLSGGPATGVTVRGDGGQVAVTTADRLGLFAPQGQRQALLSPSGRLLVDAAYGGHDLFTLDVSGTLAQVRGLKVKEVNRNLCGTLKTSQVPHLAVSGTTVAVACPAVLLIGRPGQWKKVGLPVPAESFNQASRVAVNPDASEIAVINASQVLRYHLPDLKRLPTITRLPGEDTTFMESPLTPASASALAYDAQGRRLAVGWNMSFAKAYNQSVTVYDLKSGTGRSVPTYADWTQHLVFSADGTFLLADGTSTPRIWNLTTWKRLPPPQPVTTGIGVKSVAWLGKNVVSASALGALALTPGGKQVSNFPMPLARVKLAAFSGNGQSLALAGEDGQVYLYDLKANRLVWNVKAYPYGVSSLKFNRADTLLVSGEFVRFWDAKSGKAIGPSVIGGRTVSGFTKGDQEVVMDGRIVPVAPLLRRQGEVLLESLAGHTYRQSGSTSSQLTPDGKGVCESQLIFRDRGLGFRASSWQLGALERNNFGLSLPEERQLGGTSADCRVLAVAASDVIGKEHTLKPLGVEVYDPATGKKLRMWPSVHRIKSLAVSPDGRRTAWLEQGRAELRLGEVKTGQQTTWKLPAVVQDMDDVPLVFRADGEALLVGVGRQPEMSFIVLGLP